VLLIGRVANWIQLPITAIFALGDWQNKLNHWTPNIADSIVDQVAFKTQAPSKLTRFQKYSFSVSLKTHRSIPFTLPFQQPFELSTLTRSKMLNDMV